MTLFIVSYAVGFGGLLVVVLAGIRNRWVYRARTTLLWSDHDEAMRQIDNGTLDLQASTHPNFDRLPSYDYMFWHFWIWDVNKFLK